MRAMAVAIMAILYASLCEDIFNAMVKAFAKEECRAV
jgi:hypothetical protein